MYRVALNNAVQGYLGGYFAMFNCNERLVMDLFKEQRLCIIRKAAKRVRLKRKAQVRRAIELHEQRIALRKAIQGE